MTDPMYATVASMMKSTSNTSRLIRHGNMNVSSSSRKSHTDSIMSAMGTLLRRMPVTKKTMIATWTTNSANGSANNITESSREKSRTINTTTLTVITGLLMRVQSTIDALMRLSTRKPAQDTTVAPTLTQTPKKSSTGATTQITVTGNTLSLCQRKSAMSLINKEMLMSDM